MLWGHMQSILFSYQKQVPMPREVQAPNAPSELGDAGDLEREDLRLSRGSGGLSDRASWLFASALLTTNR